MFLDFGNVSFSWFNHTEILRVLHHILSQREAKASTFFRSSALFMESHADAIIGETGSFVGDDVRVMCGLSIILLKPHITLLIRSFNGLFPSSKLNKHTKLGIWIPVVLPSL